MPAWIFQVLTNLLVRKWGIVWLFAVALIPGILAGAALLFEIYHLQRKELETGALHTARALAQAVDRDLSGIRGKLQILATSPALAQGDLQGFRRQAEDVLQGEGLGSAIVLIDATGQQLLNTLRPNVVDLPKTGHPETLDRTFNQGQPQISDLYVGGVAKRPFVAVEVPVKRGKKVVYALDMGIPPEHLQQLLIDQKLPEGWVASILDSRGTVVARNLRHVESVGKNATPDLLEKMQASKDGSFPSHTLDGTASFVAFSTSAFSGWTVAVGMPRHVLYSNLYQPLALVALSMLTFLFGGFALAWYSTRYIRNSLLSLEQAVDGAARGNLELLVPVSGPREVAQLAGQFNHMLQARKRAEEQIERLAYFDPLTNLPNRRLLSDRIQQALARADRGEGQVAVCYLDLDNFKPINDEHGHDAGDRTLLEIARRLQGAVRANDSVARLGGDEFVLLLTDLESRAECEAILARVLESVEQPVEAKEGVTARLSASIGVCLYPGDDRAPDILLRHSDQAMYEAKQGGRNRVVFFQADPATATSA